MADTPAISVRPAALPGDFEAILSTVNDAAEAYRGVIPADAVRARPARGSQARLLVGLSICHCESVSYMRCCMDAAGA